MRLHGVVRTFGRWLPVAIACALVLCLALPGLAGARPAPNAWNWASTSSYWDWYGNPFTPTLQPDPTGVRRGSVLEVEFDRCEYTLYVSNGPRLFHFESGKDYTLLFQVLETAECGHQGELDVHVVDAVPSPGCVQNATGKVWTVPDGLWHTRAVYLTDFQGPTGDYYLALFDQCGEGCWMLGDVRVTGGAGHK